VDEVAMGLDRWRLVLMEMKETLDRLFGEEFRRNVGDFEMLYKMFGRMV
jgi:hypothetical protein